MSNLNTAKEINLVSANDFTTTKESRNKLMSLLSAEEQKMFKAFVTSNKVFVNSLGTK